MLTMSISPFQGNCDDPVFYLCNKLSFLVLGEVGDFKNFIDADFDEAFHTWMNQTCLQMNRPVPDFKFEIKTIKSEDRSEEKAT